MQRLASFSTRSWHQPLPAHARLVVALVASLVASTQGCDCDDEVKPLSDGGTPVPVCTLDKDCGAANLAYRFGECRASGCESDSDCCPGTRCRVDFNACVPHQLSPEYRCDEDADCPDPAMRCLEVTLGDRDPVQACTYERCQGDSDCGPGRSCYHSVCVQTAPCGGACPDGEACDVLTGQCSPVPAGEASCAQACGASGLLVFSDPDTMSGEVCCRITCQCKGLPPLIPTRFGRYSRIAASTSELLISAYDAEYGDLVVAFYKTDGSFSRVEYVDGVPASGTVVADPNGPRGGIADPGPHVGTHTSIAIDAQGRARVAYHDVDNRSLKVAIQTEGGWQTHTVDAPGGEGTLGTFTDIAVEPATGRIHITYLAHDVTGAPGIQGPASGVKLARSRNAAPASASDWEIRWVDARPRFDPCGGQCSGAQECVLEQGAAVCRQASSACAEDCGSAGRCVDAGGAGVCRASAFPPSLTDFPRARGLYTSVALDGPETLIAYYDSIDGDLRVARVNDAGNVSASVVDGDGTSGRRDGDVGRFPAIALVGGEVFVAYEDFTRHELRAWQGATPGTGGTYATIDPGKVEGEPGKRFVGAGARVAQEGAEVPVVVYQDASNLDLKLARYANGAWQSERVLEEGAHGFYSDIAIAGGNAYLVSVLAELDPRGRERSRMGVTVRPLP